MAHLKRNKISTRWPVPRKGTKYTVTGRSNQDSGIPLLILLRDMLKLAKTRREVKAILTADKIKINGKVVKDDKFGVIVFDILSVDGKNYKVYLKNKKFAVEETKENKKFAKVIGKTILSGKRVQINMSDGRNFLTGEKMAVGDSVVINLSDGKIEKVIPMKAGEKVMVVSGSHAGEEGKINHIEGRRAEVTLGKEKVNLETECLMVI